MIVFYLAYLVAFAYLRARVGNLTLNGTIVGAFRCRSTLRARDLVWLYGSNVVAVLATLGLAVPWVTLADGALPRGEPDGRRRGVSRRVRRRAGRRGHGDRFRGQRPLRRGRVALIAFDGVFFDGRVAAAVPVRVEADGDGLALSDGTVTGRLAREGVVADAPVPGVPRTLRLPDGASIETHDHAAVAALFPERGRIARLAYALESRWPAVIASLAATAALVWLIVAVALPRAAEPVARRIEPGARPLPRPAGARDTRQDGLQADRPIAGAEVEWRRKFDDFVAGEPGAEHYAIVFRHAGAPNAFALPDGTIVVTDEMARAVGSDDEFRAVLAHEIGHVRGRHALRLVLQRSGIAVLLTALAGDAVGVTYLAVALPSMLLQSSYSREFEAEADDFAFTQLKRHGVSPQAFADLMRRLEKEDAGRDDNGAVGRYLGSHPATAERIRRAEEAR